MEQGHSKHHEHPQGDDSLPFFLPPLIMLVLTGLFTVVLPQSYALLLAGAIACGYSAYGLSHFSIHNTRFRRPLSRRWAAIHHIHHHHPDKNFGVTTPLWDIVLGTRYVRNDTRSGMS
jgi:sterol desaturase/sphingolipid hydroxylase (fatty acid hydroxylase superfamily)